MVKTILKWAGTATFTVVAGTVMAGLWLVSTQSGLHATAFLAQKFVPGLSIGGSTGSLVRPTFTDVNFAADGVTVAASEVAWALCWKDLFTYRVTLDYLRTEGVDVKVAGSDGGAKSTSTETTNADSGALSEPTSVAAFELPANLPGVTVTEVALAHTTVSIAGTADVKLARFASAVNFQAKRLSLLKPRIESLNVALPATESGAHPANWAAMEALITKEGAAGVLPTDIVIPVQLDVQELGVRDLHVSSGESDTAVSSAALTASWVEGVLKIEDARVVMPAFGAAALTGELATKGAWPINVTLTADAAEKIMPVAASLVVDGELKGRLRVAAQTKGVVAAEATVAAELATPGIPLDVRAWLDAPWVASAGGRTITVPRAELTLAGHAVDAQLKLSNAVMQSVVEGTTRTAGAEVQLQARTSLTRVSGMVLRIAPSGTPGALVVTADAAWAPSFSLAGTVKAERFLYEDWGVRFADGNGALKFTMKDEAGDITASVTEASLSARINQFAVKAAGDVFYDKNAVRAQNVKVKAGSNAVSMNGRLALAGEVAGDMKVAIAAPNLSEILSGIAGKVNGRITLSGTAAKPAFTSDVTASGLAVRGIGIDSVTLKGGFCADRDNALALRVQKVSLGSRTMDSALVRLTGRLSKHALQVRASEATGAAKLAVGITGSANLEKMQWQGELKNIDLVIGSSPWSLEKPAKIYAGADKVTAQAIALAGGAKRNGRLVVKETLVAPDALSAGVSEFRLALSDFNALLPHGMKTGGTVTGVAEAIMTKGALRWQAELNADWAGIGRPASGRKKAAGIEVKNFHVKATGDIDEYSGQGSMTAAGAPVNFSFASEEDGLSGRLRAEAFPISGVSVWLPPDTNLTGKLTSDLTLYGNLDAPRVKGSLELTEFAVSSPDLPLDMEPSYVTLAATGDAGTLHADLKTKKGAAAVSGTFAWPDLANPSAHVDIRSEELDVQMTSPVVRLRVQSNVAMDYKNGAANVTGSVRIPRGFVSVSEMPEGAESVSSDEVLVDDEGLEPAKSAPVVAAVDVTIDDKVFLSVMGLKTRLSGTLRVEQVKDRLSVNGRMALKEGTFKAYGQDLQIAKGLLIFAGPATNPDIDLQAVRNPETTEDNVTAGVKVSGAADAPKVTLFSEPEMSDEAKLSYLLTGHGLEKASDNDGTAMMTSALISLGASQAGRVVGSVGRAVGIRGLSVDTTGSGASSQVVVSGYVLPGLLVKYGMGVFDTVSTLTLKYRLANQIYLQAVSGQAQNVGIFWKFRTN